MNNINDIVPVFMSISRRDISMLLKELSQVNQLKRPTVFDHTDGFITWVQGKGWDYDQKYDAVVKYWHTKTDEGASTDKTRAIYLLKLLLENEDDVFYDKIFESMISYDSLDIKSGMSFHWNIRDDKTWNALTSYEQAFECRKKWNSSDGISKKDKLILLVPNWGFYSMYKAMISSPIILACMYKKWCVDQPRLPAYELQTPGRTRRR